MSLLRRNSSYRIIKNLSQYITKPCLLSCGKPRLWRFYCSSVTISHPIPDGCEKVYPPKIKNMAEEITKLTLMEAADLNECLMKILNIKDVPMAMGAMPFAVPVGAPAEDEEAAAQVTKSSFTVKLLKFEPTKKVAVIKEVKTHIDGMNLVQAKKFVESVPQILKADIGKDEAEKLKEALEAAGATCEIS